MNESCSKLYEVQSWKNNFDHGFRGLSLTLQKGFCDSLRQTLKPSELKVSDPDQKSVVYGTSRDLASRRSMNKKDKE